MTFGSEFYEVVAALQGNPNFRRFLSEISKRRDVLLDKTLTTNESHLFRLQGRCLELNTLLDECVNASEKLKTAKAMEKTYG